MSKGGGDFVGQGSRQMGNKPAGVGEWDGTSVGAVRHLGTATDRRRKTNTWHDIASRIHGVVATRNFAVRVRLR